MCKVFLKGGDVGLAQVSGGLAWWYRKYQRDQAPADRALYERAEAQAKASGLGLWADQAAVPPWEYRRVRRR